MKKLLGVYVLLFLNFVLQLSFTFFGVKLISAVYFTIASVIFSILILQYWFGYVNKLILKSNVVLNKKDDLISRWSFKNIDLLVEKLDLAEKKIFSSAELIGNLSDPGKFDSLNGLDSSDPIERAIQSIKGEMQRVKEADGQKEWIAQGLARFNEVLRNKLETKEYGHQIISTLVKYLKANQGGLYIEYQGTEGERHLEHVASYAYDKKGFSSINILPGDGLLGQCMIEQEYVFINDIPRNYVKINSGLGEAMPSAIIVAPLIYNQRFYGALELASFGELKPFQIEFLKKVCENIASEIASLKSMEHTKELLEESTELARQLQSREEEMKHNMEELTATQEEMAQKQDELTNTVKENERSQKELNSYLAAIDNTIASSEFGLDGRFRNANEIFLKVTGYTKEELLNKSYDFLMGEDQTMKMMWENLHLGKFFSGEFKMKNKVGKELWLNGTFNPITTEGNVPEKIMMFAQFTTQEKEKLNDLTTMVHALKSALPVLEFSKDFVCKIANEKALKIFELSRLQLRSKTILDFVAPGYQEDWNSIKKEILGSELSSLVVPFYTDSKTINYEVSISVSRNLEGEIVKVIFLLLKEVGSKVRHLAVD